MSDPISPSITADWLRCPTYGRLNREWEPVGEWKPYFAVGHAIHKGLEKLLSGSELDVAVGWAIALLREEYQENDEWPLEALEGLVRKGLAATMKKDGFVRYVLDHETVIGMEIKLGEPWAEPGMREDATTDLITSRGEDFIITDHKTSLKMEAKYINRNIIESEADHQLFDYAARATKQFSRQVTHIRRHLLVLAPTAKSLMHEKKLNPDVLAAWARGVQLEWDYIHSFDDKPLEDVPMRLTSCTTKFGRCPFWDACHTANRDPQKMAVLYNPK